MKMKMAASTVKEIQQSEAEEESVAEENANSKRDAVLKLHRQGKSEVEIAKTLGIGVGEVKPGYRLNSKV